MMSTLVFVDLESFTQVNGAQSSRVPVPLPKDSYEAIRHAYLVGTNTESEPFKGEARTPKSPHIVAPPTCHVEESEGFGTFEVAAMSHLAFCKMFSESEGAEDEVHISKDKNPAAEEEGLAAGVEGLGVDDDSYGLDDKSHDVHDQSHGLDEEGYGVEIDGLGLEEEKEAVPGEIDRDVRELYTRSMPVSDEIFSHRYRFRSLKHEQERTAIMFGAFWRPVLALEVWAGHRFAARDTGDVRSCYCVGAGEEP
nr:hypothetical protein [Tanacetum cinerariifolium]